MFLFIQNNGWRGCIVVIAENEQKAREMMEGEYNYDPSERIESFDLSEGLKFVNLGDS